MGIVRQSMESVFAAQREDPPTVGAFGLSVIGCILCWIGVSYTPSRIFFDNKSAGISLPFLATLISLGVGMQVLSAVGSRDRTAVKFVGGSPNMTAIVILMFSAYSLNVWTIEHRQDMGFATGILDDSNTAFNCYIAGAIFCLFAHFFYMWNLPARCAELKAADPRKAGGAEGADPYGDRFGGA